MRWFNRGKDGQDGCLVESVELGGWLHGESFDVRKKARRLGARPGHDGIRHSRGCSRGHRDSGNHDFPAETRRAVERDCGGDKRPIRRASGQEGQSTVEFAVVMAAFIVLVVALSVFWHMLSDGVVVEHALGSASHHLASVHAPFIVDILRY